MLCINSSTYIRKHLAHSNDLVLGLHNRCLVPHVSIADDESIKIEREKTDDLAQMISEKVKFLSEGNESVPPVQVMAIQLEVCTP